MDGKVRIEGLDDALRALRAAFPKDPEQQRRLLNQSISGAARKTILPVAKELARRGDGSGALSESLAPRAVSRTRALRKGMTASVQITPVRSNRKAMAMYIEHYYTGRGRRAKPHMITSGIRHGHLVEFGTSKMGPQPFLWPSAQSQQGAYTSQFAKSLRRKIELAVRRVARRRGR